MSAALPVGQGRDRLRLWDKQWRLIWDSATATTPAYQHISTWVRATIDAPDGRRWVGEFWRCREGIRSQAYLSPEYFEHLLKWPELPVYPVVNA